MLGDETSTKPGHPGYTQASQCTSLHLVSRQLHSNRAPGWTGHSISRPVIAGGEWWKKVAKRDWTYLCHSAFAFVKKSPYSWLRT